MRVTGVLAYLRIVDDEEDSVECGDGNGGSSSSDLFGCVRILEGPETARCASSGMRLEGEGELVCFR